jgi:putative endonuclease
MITNKKQGVFYIGVTSNLVQRIYEHKSKNNVCFSKKYNLTRLVYFEIYENIYDAIKREKQLKKWRRAWKINLVEKNNKEWEDLYEQLF